MCLLELGLEIGPHHPPLQIAEAILGMPHELMAGVEFAGRSHRQVLIAGATAGESFGGAGAARQIQLKVVKRDPAAGSFLIPQEARQPEVFSPDRRQVLLPDRIRLPGSSHHRLQRDAAGPQAGQVADILRKVQIAAGIGAAHVVLLSGGHRQIILEAPGHGSSSTAPAAPDPEGVVDPGLPSQLRTRQKSWAAVKKEISASSSRVFVVRVNFQLLPEPLARA